MILSSTSTLFSASKPAKPTNLEAKSLSHSSIQLTWAKVNNADGYYVYIYRSDNLLGKVKVTKTGVKISSQKNLKITAGKKYTLKVKAYNESGTSSFSKSVSVTPIPKTPSASVKYCFNGKNKISWKKVSGVSGYRIYRSTSKDSGYKLIKTLTDDDKISYYDSDISKKKTYYYKVRAYKTVNDKKVYGKYSTIKTVYTGVGNINNVKTSTYDENRVKVSWSKSNATGAKIVATVVVNGEDQQTFDTVYKTGTTWTTPAVKYNQPFISQGKVKIKVTPYFVYNDKKIYGTAKTYYHEFSNQMCGTITDVKVSKSSNDSITLSWMKSGNVPNVRIRMYKDDSLLSSTLVDSNYSTTKTFSNLDYGTYRFSVTPIREKDGFNYYNDAYYSDYVEVLKLQDPGLVSEATYLANYTDTSKYKATPYYRYATRTKEYMQSGYSSVSSDNGNPWVKYDSKTTTATSGYYLNPTYPEVKSPVYNDTSKVTKEIVSKGKYYYAYSLKRNSDKAFYIDSSRANVIAWAKNNYSSSSVWAEDNLYFLWYIGSESSDRTSTMNKTVKAHTDSTIALNTKESFTSNTTATLGGEQKLYYWSRCYKIKTTTLTNYFERWSTWSAWGPWTTKESTSDYKKEDTTKMYYISVIQ